MAAINHGRPQAWARGALAPPWKCLKCFLLQMLSKTSVDEVFMHHFEQCRQLLGASLPDPTGELLLDPAGGDFRPLDPLIAHPWKKSCGRPCCQQK